MLEKNGKWLEKMDSLVCNTFPGEADPERSAANRALAFMEHYYL